jgi:hypothetical protein
MIGALAGEQTGAYLILVRKGGGLRETSVSHEPPRKSPAAVKIGVKPVSHKSTVISGSTNRPRFGVGSETPGKLVAIKSPGLPQAKEAASIGGLFH